MKEDKKVFSLLMKWDGKDRYFIHASIRMALFASILSVIPYYAFYRIIDAVYNESASMSTAVYWAVIVVVGIAIKALLAIGSSLLSHKGAYHTLYKVRCKVTEHMSKMPLGALSERSTGEIKYVMNESIGKLKLFLAHNLPELVLYLSGPIVMFIYLMTVSSFLALISIIPLLLVVIVMIIMFKRFGKIMEKVNESSGNLSEAIHEYVIGKSQSSYFIRRKSSLRRRIWCGKKHISTVDIQIL